MPLQVVWQLTWPAVLVVRDPLRLLGRTQDDTGAFPEAASHRLVVWKVEDRLAELQLSEPCPPHRVNDFCDRVEAGDAVEGVIGFSGLVHLAEMAISVDEGDDDPPTGPQHPAYFYQKSSRLSTKQMTVNSSAKSNCSVRNGSRSPGA